MRVGMGLIFRLVKESLTKCFWNLLIKTVRESKNNCLLL